MSEAAPPVATDFMIFGDIPMPKSLDKRQAKGQTKYPFSTMEVGKMFFIAGRKAENFAAYAGTWGRTLGRRFKCYNFYMKKKADGTMVPCKSDEKGAIEGVGVWRQPDPTAEELEAAKVRRAKKEASAVTATEAAPASQAAA